MVTPDELQKKYGFLLQPIKDLTKNWDVDIAHILEDYLEELEKMTFSFDNGKTVLNFAEASLLIQGSACVWSRKVECLSVMVKQTLDMIASKRTATEQDQENADTNQTEGCNFDDDDEKLLKLDDIVITSRRQMSGAYEPVAPIPLVPPSMLDTDNENRGRVIMSTLNTDAVCYTNDFWENHFIPFEKGISVLDNDSDGVLNDIIVPSLEDLASTPISSLKEQKDNQDEVPLEPDFDDLEDDNTGGYEDADSVEVPMQPGEKSIDEVVIQKMQLRQRDRLIPLKAEELPTMLDPHEHCNTWLVKPCQKRNSCRLPDSLTSNPRKRKLNGPLSLNVSTISEFITEKEFHKRKMNDKVEHTNILGFVEVESKRIAQHWKNIKKEVMSTESAAILGIPDKEIGNDSVFGEDDLAAPEDPDFSTHSENISPNVEDLIADVADTQGKDANLEPCETTEDSTSYEELVRHHVEMFYSAARRYKEETALSQRVKLWEEAILPRLTDQDARPEFDIHKYGDVMLGKFDKPQDSGYFKDIVSSPEPWYICRLFAATLQLVNDNNFSISKEQDFSQSVNTMKLTLLSHHKLRERLDDYTAQSQQT